MVEEQSEMVYDIGFSYGNPCRYMQQVFKSFLKCLGLESEGNERQGKQKGDNNDGGSDGYRGKMVDDPPSDDPSTMDPIDEPAISTRRRIARIRPPPRPPITSGGPGQTN